MRSQKRAGGVDHSTVTNPPKIPPKISPKKILRKTLPSERIVSAGPEGLLTLFLTYYLQTFDPELSYAKAYDIPLREVGSRARDLLRNGHVISRIDHELKKIRHYESPDMYDVTYQSHMEMLGILRDEARGAHQYGVAMHCELARGKASNIYDSNWSDRGGSLKEIHDMVESRRSKHAVRSEEYKALAESCNLIEETIIVGPSEAELYEMAGEYDG